MIRFLFRLVFFLFALILSVKAIPPYVENSKVSYVFRSVVANPDLKNVSDAKLLDAVQRRLAVEGITVLNSEQIDIARDGDRVTLGADYSVKIKVFDNISLLLEFHPTSNP